MTLVNNFNDRLTDHVYMHAHVITRSSANISILSFAIFSVTQRVGWDKKGFTVTQQINLDHNITGPR